MAFACNKPTEEAAEAIEYKDTFTILSYNVHHCNPPEDPGLIDVDGIARVIKDIDADWVALQEIDVNTGRSGGIDQVTLLAEKSGYEHYFFSKTIDHDGGDYGILMLSKYPLSEKETHRLPTEETIGGEPRVLSTAVIQLGEDLFVQVGNTHLDSEWDNTTRLMQMETINDIAESSSYPFVLAGDLNAEEDNEVIRLLDSQFTKSCIDCPDTFSEDGEIGTLDYVAYRPGDQFEIISHQVFDNIKASDHFPVVVKLKIK